MKLALLLLPFIFCLNALAETDIVRWNELITIVQQEIKILEKSKNKRPKLEYRLLELYTERLKLVHEKNNNAFVADSADGKLQKEKSDFFHETRNHYQIAKVYGLSLLKEYATHPHRSEIAYTIGLNSRDYSNDGISEQMLLESMRSASSQNNFARNHLAQLALAETLYSSAQFAKAVPYYEKVVANIDDTWRAKHMYNLSWCYLKSTQLPKALSTMREALTLNQNPKYIQISDQLLNSLGSFYTSVGRPLDAMNLYLTKTDNPLKFLISLAAETSEKGHAKETEIILAEAQKRVLKDKAYQYQEAIYHSYLDYYRQYNKFKEHAQVSRMLTNFYQKAATQKAYTTELKSDAVAKFRSIVGFIQLKLTKDVKHNSYAFKQDDLTQVLDYFQHLIVLDPSKKAEYHYFEGETNYSVQMLEPAANAYQKSIDESYKNKDHVQLKKALYSLLDLTGQEKLEKELNKNYLTYAYTLHIKLWPKDDNSKVIYGKLFELFQQQNQDKKAAGVLEAYSKSFPQEVKHQQFLMTRVIDQLIEQKDIVKLSAWISRFKGGFLAFAPDSISKMETALANTLFVEYQKMSKNGSKLEAAKGFGEIYSNKIYSRKLKGEAALLASMAYLELADTEQSYKWQVLAFEQMTDKELLAHRHELVKIAERTYKLQDFDNSYKLSSSFLKRFCQEKDENQQRLYEISVMTSLVEANPAQAEQIVSYYSSCLKSNTSRDIALSQIYQEHEKSGQIKPLKKFVATHNAANLNASYRQTLQRWYWERSDKSLRASILSEFDEIGHPQTVAWAKEIRLYQEAAKRVEELDKVVIWKSPKFDGEAFNQSLEKHLQDHQSFKTSYQSLTNSSQLDMVINSTKLFSRLYTNLGKKVQSLSPAGMDATTVKEFKSAMNQVGGEFLKASSLYGSQLKTIQKSEKTLSQAARSIASIEDVENPIRSKSMAVPMDQGK